MYVGQGGFQGSARGPQHGAWSWFIYKPTPLAHL